MAEDYLELMIPIAEKQISSSQLAPRRASLQSGTIGLLDNNKPNADRFLEYLGDLLGRRFPQVRLLYRRKMTSVEADCLTELAEKCDAVISAFAD